MSFSAIIPFFWILSTPASPWFQVVPNFIGGAVWIGLDLSQMSLMMKILPKENRSVYIAGYGLTAWLVGNAVGALIAGLLAQFLKPWMAHAGLTLFGTPLVAYQIIFLLSLILRFVALLLFLPRVEEAGAHSLKASLSLVFRSKTETPPS